MRCLLTFLPFLWPFIIQAQICNGSLGDPAVNITFGTGGNSNTGYTPTNAYTYTSSSCPNDGYYTITNSTTGCFNNSWHTVSRDHTGSGAFMLVNASYSPGDFFVSTVSDLCPNTTYEFAAWIMNVITYNSIKPNVTFTIETPSGAVLQQFSTGDIPETSQPQWKQYGFFFTTPVNNPVIVLRMKNNAPGGIGNDIALDDITFRPCGEKVTAGIINNSDTINVCEGNTDIFTFTGAASANYQFPVYNWQISVDTGATWQDITGANTTSYIRQPEMAPQRYMYRLSVVDASVQGIVKCRINSTPLVINVHSKPLVDAGPDRVYLTGYPVILNATAGGDQITYEWTPVNYMNDPFILNPTVSPLADVIYTLAAQSVFGCVKSDSVFVKSVAGIFVPTAFTPNGDGKNDTWQIPYLDIGFEADVKVYNRWGNLVYHSIASIVSWDGKWKGKPQVTGTYMYVVTFKNKEFKMLKGTFALIR